jgi:hypothetical protein
MALIEAEGGREAELIMLEKAAMIPSPIWWTTNGTTTHPFFYHIIPTVFQLDYGVVLA